MTTVALNIMLEDGDVTHKEYSKGTTIGDVLADLHCDSGSFSLFLEAEPLNLKTLVEEVPAMKVLFLMQSCDAGSSLYA